MTSEIRSKRVVLGNVRAMSNGLIPFLCIILVLGSWSVGFLGLLENRSFIPEVIRFLTFFGGLVVSVIIGGFFGSILSRMIKGRNSVS